MVATISGWDLSSRNGRVVDSLEPSNVALSGIQHSVFIPCFFLFFFVCVRKFQVAICVTFHSCDRLGFAGCVICQKFGAEFGSLYCLAA